MCKPCRWRAIRFAAQLRRKRKHYALLQGAHDARRCTISRRRVPTHVCARDSRAASRCGRGCYSGHSAGRSAGSSGGRRRVFHSFGATLQHDERAAFR